MAQRTVPPEDGAGTATATATRPIARSSWSVVDSGLSAGAVVLSVLALAVLAGLPSDDGGIGTTVRGLVLLLFWLVAPGSAITVWLRLPISVKVAVTPLTGIAVLAVVSTLCAWTGFWQPRLLFVVVAAAALVVNAGAAVHARSLPRLARLRRPQPLVVVLALALVAAVVLWGLALPRIRTSDPSVLGLLVSGPWELPAAILLTVAVALVALVRGRTWLVVASTAVAILVLRTTAAGASAVPYASWTYKHIAIVHALQELQHTAGGDNIYMNWPAMFASSAFFGDASGVTALDMARWFTPLVHVLLALSTAALARTFGARALGCAAAALAVVLFNWVGQDYFSPQALAMCMAAGILVLLVRSHRSVSAAVLALGLYAVVVPMHQLTPFWLLGLAFLLAVVRRTPWWVPVVMALLAGGFLATRYHVVADFGLFTGFDVLNNATTNVVPVDALGRDAAGWFARGAAVLMWLSTLVVLVRRARRQGWRTAWRQRDVVVQALLAFSPFALLAGQSYGGEAVLRVALYSTVGCAAVLGPALAAALHGRRPRRRAVTVAAGVVWAVVVLVVVAQATYGSWYVNYLRPEEVRAANALEQTPDALVIPVVGDWAGRGWLDPVAFQRADGRDRALNSALRLYQLYTDGDGSVSQSLPLSRHLFNLVVAQEATGSPVYVVFTASMREYDAYYRTYDPGAYQALLDDLRTDPAFSVVRHEGDTWVLRYTGPGAG